MADNRAPLALYHILDAVRDFLAIVGDATSNELAEDRTRRYAAERCVEIVSEASRPCPRFVEGGASVDPMAGHRRNRKLRHNYDDVNLDIIVKLRGQPLDRLERATLALLAKYDPEGREFRDRN